MMILMLIVILIMYLIMINEMYIFLDKIVFDLGRILRNEENNWIVGDVVIDLLYR